jgi:hypothetical protein
MLGLILISIFFTITGLMVVGELVADSHPNTKFSKWWRLYVIAPQE